MNQCRALDDLQAWWKDLLARYETDSVHTLGQASRSARRRADRIQPAEIIMNRLQGWPRQGGGPAAPSM